MDKIRLGRTELMVSKTSFGALPIQRIGHKEAQALMRHAFDHGVNYFDTANCYTDSEEKIGETFHALRDQIIISTKSMSDTKEGVVEHSELSLKRMQTDYIDLFQFHNPAILPDPQDPNGSYAGALEAQKRGYIRHIGITNHRLDVANKAVESGNFATMQFPFSYLSGQGELDLIDRCKAADMGYIAMKGLSGGLLTNARACYVFMQQHPTVVPIWGIQHQWELDQFLTLTEENPAMTPEMETIIAADRKELAGNFCRGCGYCLPCPADIQIPQAARMSALLRRAPSAEFLTPDYNATMHRIDNCIHCNACKSRCPYELDIPHVLQAMLVDYDACYAQNQGE